MLPVGEQAHWSGYAEVCNGGSGQRRLRSVMQQSSDRVCISDGGQGRFSSVIRIPLRVPIHGLAVNPRLESVA